MAAVTALDQEAWLAAVAAVESGRHPHEAESRIQKLHQIALYHSEAALQVGGVSTPTRWNLLPLLLLLTLRRQSPPHTTQFLIRFENMLNFSAERWRGI